MPTEGHLLRAWRSKLATLNECSSLLQCTLGIPALEHETRASIEKMLRNNHDEAKIYQGVIEKLEHKT